MRLIDADAIIDYQHKTMVDVYGRYADMLKDHLDVEDALSVPIHAMEVYSRGKQFFFGLKGILDAAPTVDAVPVVRCKDCIYRDGTPGQPNIICHQMHDDDFCSYGERKERKLFLSE